MKLFITFCLDTLRVFRTCNIATINKRFLTEPVRPVTNRPIPASLPVYRPF